MVIICSYWSSPDVWVQVSEWAAAQSSSWLQGKRPPQRKQYITELTWRKGKLTAARIRLFPHYRSLAVEELSYPTRRSTTKEGNSGKKNKDTWAKTRQLTPEPCWGGVPEMTCVWLYCCKLPRACNVLICKQGKINCTLHKVFLGCCISSWLLFLLPSIPTRAQFLQSSSEAKWEWNCRYT